MRGRLLATVYSIRSQESEATSEGNVFGTLADDKRVLATLPLTFTLAQPVVGEKSLNPQYHKLRKQSQPRVKTFIRKIVGLPFVGFCGHFGFWNMSQNDLQQILNQRILSLGFWIGCLRRNWSSCFVCCFRCFFRAHDTTRPITFPLIYRVGLKAVLSFQSELCSELNHPGGWLAAGPAGRPVEEQALSVSPCPALRTVYFRSLKAWSIYGLAGRWEQ